MDVFNVTQVDALPVTAQQLGQATCSSLALHKDKMARQGERMSKAILEQTPRTDR